MAFFGRFSRIGSDFIYAVKTLSPFAPQKCVSKAHFCGAKGDTS